MSAALWAAWLRLETPKTNAKSGALLPFLSIQVRYRREDGLQTLPDVVDDMLGRRVFQRAVLPVLKQRLLPAGALELTVPIESRRTLLNECRYGAVPLSKSAALTRMSTNGRPEL